MISSNGLRPGLAIEYNNAVWQIVESMHVKPGKGAALVQAKLRNLMSDESLRVNFRAGEKLVLAHIEKLDLTFTHKEHENYVLIDSSGTRSIELQPVSFGKNLDLVKEGLNGIIAYLHKENVFRIELPTTVELQVSQTPPGERGDTSSGGSKMAIMETGAAIAVPFHIKPGEFIYIDTRTREYAGRQP